MWKGLGLTPSAEAEGGAEGSAGMAMWLQGRLKRWKREVGVEEEIQNLGKVWATKEMGLVHVVRLSGGYSLDPFFPLREGACEELPIVPLGVCGCSR